MTAVIWLVQVANSQDHYGFNRFGLYPRRVDGLWGVLTQPFLHTSYQHMLSDSLPVLVIGWVVMLSGLRTWATVSMIVIVVGGLLTWAWSPAVLVVGSSSLYFGWLGYIVARAVFSRRLVWIMTAVFVVFFFAALIGQLLPSVNHNESWQAHVAGLVAGVIAGAVLHRRRPARRRDEP